MYHHVRLNKDFRFSTPVTFMAQSKNIVEEAYPGDVVGLYDTGNFKIGDVLTEGEDFRIKGIPSFSPEIFQRVGEHRPNEEQTIGERNFAVDRRRRSAVVYATTRQPQSLWAP
jgi:peptide subunit release factor RF-3